MEHQFWHQRWQDGRIGFHQAAPNNHLQNSWSTLELAPETRVLVPLCGKSLDMYWLQQQGHAVIGVELSTLACEQFFCEQQLPFKREQKGCFEQFSGAGIELLCGDFFKLESSQLHQVGAVYDRAALIALPREMRAQYAQFMIERLPKGIPMLLVTLEFEGEQGPPFSVEQAEVEALFGRCFMVERLAEEPVTAGPGKGGLEVVYRLAANS